MTRAIHRSPVKDENSSVNCHLNHERRNNAAIGSHLRSHVHLTNCIHLKNHMHQQSPSEAERSLMKNLIALQRSRSLKDPSTSPPSWVSLSITGSFARRTVHDCAVHNERRSIERRSEVGRLSTSSPTVESATLLKVLAGEADSDYDIERGGKNAEVSKEDAGTEHYEAAASGSKKTSKDSPENIQGKENKRHGKNANRQRHVRLRMHSQQLEEVRNQISHDDMKCPPVCQPERRVDEIYHGPKGSIYNNLNRRNLVTKHRTKGSGIPQRSADLRSNHVCSLTTGSHFVAKRIGNGHDSELDIAGPSKNVCGIPWNWSRIHHRGKTFLDKAGRSLSCGLSDSRLRKTEAPFPETEGNSSSEVARYGDLTPTSSDSEVLPLLNEASGSHDGGANHLLSQDFSGELGIFSNYSSRQEIDSDHAFQARLGNHWKSRDCNHDRHKSLTQKYMPKAFKEIVGQTLVVQALSNAVLMNKVGLIYIFYGPHGTGKTSCARVFAKALNCQSPEHLRPCNACNSCTLHNLGRSNDVLELGPLDISENMVLSPRSSQYKVFIIDDCDTLPTNSWGAISKAIDGVPKHAVFILISLNLNHFPHTIISRCQKFFFPKLKDSDIISILQWISTNEGLEIDKDALKFVASRCNGSLRDAEMTLDQLSLLGQRVSLSLVQELVGLAPDEKLVDLLDLALSADTVNTVKALRGIMEAGVEPLALMSQLATIITDILAGSYVFTRERLRRKFFHQVTLSKEDMEKLRQALKRLSEAEKQLRVSNDRLTWLTAVLLQLAPEQQYMPPNSSTDRSFSHTPIILNKNSIRGATRNPVDEHDGNWDLSRGMRIRDFNSNFRDIPKGATLAPGYVNVKEPSDHISHNLVHSETNKATKRYSCDRTHKVTNIKEIWQAVLLNIKSDAIRKFLYSEGKIHSVNLGAAPTVHLVFSSNVNKSRAEKLRVQILQAFEATLASSVILEIRCESRSDAISDVQHAALIASDSENSYHATKRRQCANNHTSVCSGPQYLQRSTLKADAGEGTDFENARWSLPGSHVIAEDEIINVGALPRECQYIDPSKMNIVPKERGLESAWIEETSSLSERKYTEEQRQNKSMVRGKLPLGHAIQQAEGSSEQAGWSRHKAISIAEKLEQDNLKLEPRYRRLICWKSRKTRAKLAKLRIRSRKPCGFMNLLRCGRCLSLKTPR